MVLAAIWEERTRRKALAEGREEGRREIQALWLAWNSRRLEAEEKGEVFQEPPPALNSNRNRHNGGSR